MKVITALTFTLLYVAIFSALYVVHAWYFPVKVVFYAALADAALASLILALLLFALKTRIPLGNFEKTLLVMAWLLFGYSIAISVPTVLDRSLSFYILEKLQQRGGGIQESHFADVFVKEYIPETRLMDVRLTEQVQSGTVRIENGCVTLTERGQRIASFSRYFRTHFLPKHRLLGTEYTDALVDPFATSPMGKMGYECE